jgi:hypothetical protein
MPFTEQELQNYQFYLQLEEERDKKYQDFYEEAISESDSTTRNHLLVKDTNTLYSFEDIDEERRKEAPFGRIGLDDPNHYVHKVNRYPTFEKGEKLEKVIDTEINSLIPLAPSLPTIRLYEAPNNNVLSPQKDGVEFTLLSPSREEPNVRTNGYTIDLVNGDIVGYFDWNDNEGFGLNLYFLEENRKRRFPSMKVFKSYVGTLITRQYEQEIIIINEDDLDLILNGKPMQFNVG